MDTMTTARSLDRTGRTIATFVVFDAAAELHTMADGEVLELLTDYYPPLLTDIESWCRATGHKLVSSERTATGNRLWIQKHDRNVTGSRLAMVISDDGLEELLSPLGFALAAALEGMDVSLFIQGPAVRVLGRGFRPTLRGWARPFSRLARSGMARSGHISAQDKLRQLVTLGGHIYLCGPSMQHFKVDREDLFLRDLQIVEYLTFMSVMEQADIHLYT